jgi:hypothetical protein
MHPIHVSRRFLALALVALMLGLLVQPVIAAPIEPPATLDPPIPPDALDVACVETGRSIICTYREEFPADEAPYPFLDCATVQVLEQFLGISVAVTRTYDLSGTLLEEVRRVRYGTVLSTDALAAAIGTREGHFTATIDFQDGTIASVTYTGLTTQIMIDGHAVAVDAGRVVLVPTGPDTYMVVSASGRHDFISPGLLGPGLTQTPVPPNTQAICAAVM